MPTWDKPPVFFAASFAASPRISISLASQRRRGSGWKVPSAENQVVKEVSISFSWRTFFAGEVYLMLSL